LSSYRLEKLFAPESVAVIGASPRPGSVGRSVLANLRQGGFPGAVYAINPRYELIDGLPAYPTIASLPEAPELIVLVTPAATVPSLIEDAGARGTAAAVIITSGLGHGPGSLAAETDAAARRHSVRLLGPNCLGFIAPRARLNASFAARMPGDGELALVSQSGAIAAGVMEWAASRGIGFSAVASLGDQIDIDFSDLLDHLAQDRGTRAILLYIESLTNARKFMSAARAAARAKPVAVIKAGRHAAGARAAATHTGTMAGADAVYDAAFRRAGLLRVHDLDQLFGAAQTLGFLRPVRGTRLAILTNGGGVGVLAVDRLVDLGGTPARLSPSIVARLDAMLPATWSRDNPVDIIGDADAARYAAALEILLEDPFNDAVLVLTVPTSLVSPSETAQQIAAVVKSMHGRQYPGKPVLASWIGGDQAALSAFIDAGIPNYPTEADAVGGFMFLAGYSAAQERLMQMPPALPSDQPADTAAARGIVHAAIDAGRRWLDPLETVALLEHYRIPIAPVELASNGEQASILARPALEQGQAIAVKLYAHGIQHKSDVGGVALDLTSEQAVRDAAAGILERASRLRPDARVIGVLVQPMIRRRSARELIAGISDDEVFGPVMLFGHGGTGVEVIDDKALALPPLDLPRARDLIARTRVSKLLAAYRNVPAADVDAVAAVLVRLARLAVEIPEVRELDINPLLADELGALAVDARIAIHDHRIESRDGARLAIRPYPSEWEQQITIDGDIGVQVRPVRPEDEPLFTTFFARTSAEDLRLRFFYRIRTYDHHFIARLTQIDYARSMAFIAIDERNGELIGVARFFSDADYQKGECAILIRSDMKGRGLGRQLMRHLIDYTRAEGLSRLEGEVLSENQAMLDMCRQLGFTIALDPAVKGVHRIALDLGPACGATSNLP
jgi:acetyltransferase